MMEKRCRKCGLVQPLEDFNRLRKAPDGRETRCRQCAKQWYANNKESHKKNTRRISREVTVRYREKLVRYLREHPCVDCGETDLTCLEFDHRDPSIKVAEIAKLMRDRAAWVRIEAEIDKCDVRCANCHRIVTAQRGSSWRVTAQAAAREAEAMRSHERLARLFA